MTQSYNIFTSQPSKNFFIDAQYIKDYYIGYLDPNIDTNSINSFILRAQTERTQSVLGFNLYIDFSTALINYYNLGMTMSTAYTTLWKSNECSIIDELALWTVYYAWPFFGIRATNKGLVNKTSQWSRPINPIDGDWTRNEIRNSAQYADQRILQYITNNVPLFPYYFNQTQINSIPAMNYVYSGMAGGVWLNNGWAGYGMNNCCGPYNRELGW